VREHPNISQISDLDLFCVQIGCFQLGFPALVFHQSVRRRSDEKQELIVVSSFFFHAPREKARPQENTGKGCFASSSFVFRISCKYTPWTSNVETVEYHLKCASFNVNGCDVASLLVSFTSRCIADQTKTKSFVVVSYSSAPIGEHAAEGRWSCRQTTALEGSTAGFHRPPEKSRLQENTGRVCFFLACR
jgi:hypothetical protein